MTLRVVGLGDDAVDGAIAAGVERGAGDRFDRGADAETAIQRVEREKGVFQGARPAPDARAAPGGNERLYPGVDLEAAEGLTEIDALARGETVHCRGYLYAVGRVAVAVHGLQEGRDIARDFQRRGRENERRDRRGARRLADEDGADEKAHGFALPIGEFAIGVGPAVGRRGAVAQAGYRTIDETSRERRRRAGGLAAGGRTGAVVGAASSAAGGQQAGGRDDEQWC